MSEEEEEWIEDLFTHQMILIRRLKNEYSRWGKLEKQKVFDADNHHAYTLEWDWDSHGNLISETNAMGIKTAREYDKATDNLDKEERTDVKIKNTYDFVNRLIEKKEIHADAEFVTNHRYDLLGNCKSTTNSYGHSTHYHYDEFGRVIHIKYPEVLHEGILAAPIEKRSYDIAGHLISSTDANGNETGYKMNIRGQPTKIFYPDGTSEEMLYSLEGWLMQKTARNGMITRYERDFMGRVKNEEIQAEEVKQTQYVYNSFHLMNETDPEGNITHYAYDFAGRVKEVVKNNSKTQYFYDSLGRLSQTREFYGNESDEYRVTLRSYDLLDRIKEEKLQATDGTVLLSSCYDYDVRGNVTLVQTGDNKLKTEYNSWNQPIEITDNMGHKTHITYDIGFINGQGQKVLRKKTTDPLGYQTIEIYDTADRLVESIRLNKMGDKVARQLFSYDLAGNQIKTEEEVIEQGQVVRAIVTLFSYNSLNQLTNSPYAKGADEGADLLNFN